MKHINSVIKSIDMTSSYKITEGIDLYYNELKARSFENYEIFLDKLGNISSVIKNLFDIQQELFKNRYKLILNGYSDDLPSRTVIVAAYLKSMYALFTSTELVLKGFYGSARIILRQVLEFLIIAKYSSLTHDVRFIKYWESGGNLGIGKQVFKKFDSKMTTNLYALWSDLCAFNHATSFSQQIGVRCEDVKEYVITDLSAITILLNCNYHLLTKLLTDNTMTYFINEFYKEEEKEAKRNAQELLKVSKSILSKSGLTVIKEYSSVWQIKS